MCCLKVESPVQMPTFSAMERLRSSRIVLGATRGWVWVWSRSSPTVIRCYEIYMKKFKRSWWSRCVNYVSKCVESFLIPLFHFWTFERHCEGFVVHFAEWWSQEAELGHDMNRYDAIAARGAFLLVFVGGQSLVYSRNIVAECSTSLQPSYGKLDPSAGKSNGFRNIFSSRMESNTSTLRSPT